MSSVLLTPFTVDVYKVTENVNGANRAVWRPDYPVIVIGLPCHLHPTSANGVYNKYQLQLMRPHELMSLIQYSDYVKPGYWIKMGDRIFTVGSPNLIYNVGGVLGGVDHFTCALDELQYTSAGSTR